MANGTFLQQIGDVAQVLSGAVSPGVGPKLSGLRQGRQEQGLIQQLQQQFQQGGNVQTSPQLAQLAGLNPQAAQQVSNVFGQIGAQREQQLFQDAEEVGLRLAAGDTRGALNKLNTRIQQITLAGGDPSDTQEILTAIESGDIQRATQGLNATRQLGRQLGILQAAPGVQRLKKSEIVDGQVVEIGPGGQPVARPIAGFREPEAGVSDVQSSKILPGGLVQFVRKDGTVEIVEPEAANIELIKTAERRGAELQGLRAGERGAAAESIKVAGKAFTTLAATRKSIANMDEGIRLLEGGAKVGVIEGRLPSIRAASIKLDNLRGRLGLDVIGGTTFGALSEAELQFALKVALPKDLDEQELLDWMREKRDAQAKLSTNLEEAALFLSDPVNNIDDFILLKREQRAEREATVQGGQVGRFVVEVE